VAGDERSVAALVAGQLKPLDIECIEAHSGEEAVERFARDQPDLVLMDMAMPGMGGLEATCRIKAMCGERWVPIILASAMAGNEALTEALAAGADDHLPMPLRAEFVRAKVGAVARTLRLRQRLEIAAGVFEHIRDGVIITDADQRIVDANPAFTQITGYTREDLIGQTPRIYGGGLTPRSVFEDMWRQVREQGFWRGEVVNRRKNGVAHPELISVVAVKEAGAVRHYVGIVSRVNTHRDDVVTGLPGRRALNRRLAAMLASARGERRRVALLTLDIDRFKEVNEAFGYETGDMLLRELGERLRAGAGPGGQVYRIGNDEYAVVKADAGSGDAFEEFAEGLPEVVARPFFLGTEVVHITASVGVAFFPDDAGGPESLLSNAELAMQKARPLGGGRLEYFVATRQREARERRKLVDDLRQSIADGHFGLVYQPIVALATRRAVKAEALLRWRHPVRGLVAPGNFIAAAERTGLIRPIGQWVLVEAIGALRRIRRRHPGFQVSVNLSAAQVMGDDFDVARLLDLLRGADVPPGDLVFEFTEGVLLQASAGVLERLRALRDAGIRFALDDYGTGYSSLSYLQQFEVDLLKIDQAFVQVDPADRKRRALCEAILSMCRALGIPVVAEGIETEEQHARLASLGCECGQGYLYGRPVELGELERSLDASVSAA
jgi:diguanylate cyclase (GGDEF)-like protein/PAS domain S-box-containing protein